MKVYLAGGLTTGNIHVDKIEKVLQALKNDGLKIYILELSKIQQKSII